MADSSLDRIAFLRIFCPNIFLFESYSGQVKSGTLCSISDVHFDVYKFSLQRKVIPRWSHLRFAKIYQRIKEIIEEFQYQELKQIILKDYVRFFFIN